VSIPETVAHQPIGVPERQQNMVHTPMKKNWGSIPRAFTLCLAALVLLTGFLTTPAVVAATHQVGDADGTTTGSADIADVLLITSTYLQKTPQFLAAVGEYKAVLLGTEGLAAEYVEVDSDDCIARYGIKATNPFSWLEVQEVIAHISGLTGARYILLLGDQMVVPRPVADTSTPGAEVSRSPQITIVSDAWYVDFDGDRIVDEGYSVARMPDLGTACAVVTAALETASELHLAGGYTLDYEVRFSADGYTTPPWGVCGPCGDKSRFFDLVSSSDYLMFAGHGDPYGFYNNSHQPIFKTQYTDSLDLRTHRPVIIGYFSCNTGLLYPGTPTLGYEFTRAGASAFVARTSTTGVPVHVVDNFPPAIMAGERIGDALFRTMRETVLIWGNSFKGAAGHLVLFGDPTLKRRIPAPQEFAGTYTTDSDELLLRWHSSRAVDLSHYDIHRDVGPDFVPTAANLIAQTTDTTVVLTGVPPVDSWYIKVVAVNVHGNKSDYVLLASVDVTVPTFVTGRDVLWNDGAVEITWTLLSDLADLDFEIWRRGLRDRHYDMINRNVGYDGRAFRFIDDTARPGREYGYRVDVLSSGTVETSFEVLIKTPVEITALRPNSPNPFNPTTTIRYSIAEDGPVTLRIYDTAGRLIRTLVDEPQSPRAGGFTIAWNGQNDKGREVSSGVYFCRLNAGKQSQTIKMVLLR
jgi:hypothetical protein